MKRNIVSSESPIIIVSSSDSSDNDDDSISTSDEEINPNQLKIHNNFKGYTLRGKDFANFGTLHCVLYGKKNNGEEVMFKVFQTFDAAASEYDIYRRGLEGTPRLYDYFMITDKETVSPYLYNDIKPTICHVLEFEKAINVKSLNGKVYPKKEQKRIVLGVAELMKRLKNEYGFEHNDIKGSNIMEKPCGDFYLIDFEKSTINPEYADDYIDSDSPKWKCFLVNYGFQKIGEKILRNYNKAARREDSSFLSTYTWLIAQLQ